MKYYTVENGWRYLSMLQIISVEEVVRKKGYYVTRSRKHIVIDVDPKYCRTVLLWPLFWRLVVGTALCITIAFLIGFYIIAMVPS